MKPYYETKLGKLYHGDCLEIMPKLDNVDLVLTDPPYGIKENEYRVNSRSKLAKTIDYGSFDWDNKPCNKEIIDLLITKAKFSIIWGGNYFNLPPSRCWLVWDKVNGKSNFADCELAWTNFKKSVRMFSHMWNGMQRASEGHNDGMKRFHPTQKPVALMIWCLGFYDGTVLDGFCGSGPVPIACERLRRKWIAIEIEEKYCAIAAKRIENELEQKRLF